jgi:hypothetical protein
MTTQTTTSKLERPILMSPMMVEAIMAGRKTKTRRELKGLPDEDDAFSFTKMVIDPEIADPDSIDDEIVPMVLYGTCAEFNKGEWVIKCPFGSVGDILWIKETTWWEKGKDFTNVAFKDGTMITMKAGKQNKTMKIPDWKPTDKKIWKGRPSMFMPKTLCRLRLEITSIRVERLHDITEEDAIKEGVMFYDDPTKVRRYKDYLSNAKGYGDSQHDYPSLPTAKKSFESLWESINGKGSHAKNQWVWVIEFKVVKNNINQ